jgi:hypothetical protein
VGHGEGRVLNASCLLSLCLASCWCSTQEQLIVDQHLTSKCRCLCLSKCIQDEELPWVSDVWLKIFFFSSVFCITGWIIPNLEIWKSLRSSVKIGRNQGNAGWRHSLVGMCTGGLHTWVWGLRLKQCGSSAHLDLKWDPLSSRVWVKQQGFEGNYLPGTRLSDPSVPWGE